MIHRTWCPLSGRDSFHVAVSGRQAETVAAETQIAIEAAIAEIRNAGLLPENIVRSRIWARDAEARGIASEARHTALGATFRGASSSFIDAERLPADATMMVELVALHAGSDAGGKAIHEYDKPVPAPMIVSLDGLAFLSGNTDSSAGLDSQLGAIEVRIFNALARLGVGWDRVVASSAYLSKTLDPQSSRALLNARFPEIPCPVSVTTVAGFSSPEKFMEIEISAELH